MGTTAIYCRISTQQQQYDRQKDELLDLARNLSMEIDSDKLYVDIISGFKEGELRPSFSELLHAVDRGEVKIVLFSEFSRLARNSTELLAQIDNFQKRNVELYFQKQNLWVRGRQDLGTKILLNVLAVVSSYEIELFSQRSISGKISKFKDGKNSTGSVPYGYQQDSSKKLIKCKEEVSVIHRIFTLIIEGKSAVEVAEVLNMDKISSPYKRKLSLLNERRILEGVGEKEYKRYDVNDIKWRPSTINRLIKNKIYIGKRTANFYEPDPTNSNKISEREDRRLIENVTIEDESLRIVDDDMFNTVQEIVQSRRLNKNANLKIESMLKPLMKCGECGGNFSINKAISNAKRYEQGGRTYKCYRSISRRTVPKTCFTGSEMRMWRLDGIVLQLSLQMFASADLEKTNEVKTKELIAENNALSVNIQRYNEELDVLTASYKRKYRRLLQQDGDDDIIAEILQEETHKYKLEKEELEDKINDISSVIHKNGNLLNSLTKMRDNKNLKVYMQEIRTNKSLIRMMVDEYIYSITVYRPSDLWNLIIVKYNNGTEIWGTIKSARYKNDEMFYDEMLSQYGVEFKSIVVTNYEGKFHYSKDTKTITYDGGDSIMTNIDAGTYTFDEFKQLLEAKDWVMSFPLFDYEGLEEKQGN